MMIIRCSRSLVVHLFLLILVGTVWAWIPRSSLLPQHHHSATISSVARSASSRPFVASITTRVHRPDRSEQTKTTTKKNLFQSCLEECRRKAAVTLMSGGCSLVLLLFAARSSSLPATAQDVPIPQAEAATLHRSSRAVSSRTAPPSLLVGAAQQDTTALLVEESGVTILDEVWELIHKYYIDQASLVRMDWDGVRETYRRKAATTSSSSASLAAEMTSLLGDKYSRFLTVQQYAAIQKYDLIGVGVTLMPSDATQSRMIVGAPPVANSEADRVGIRKGDEVVAINGVSTKGKTAFDIIDQIGEDPNAPTITMRIVHSSSSSSSVDAPQPVDVVMQRTFAKVQDPIQYRLLTTTTPRNSNDRSSSSKTTTKRVAYIQIAEFNALVKGRLEAALTTAHNDNVDAYIIDMRHNTGGAFQSAVEIAGLLLPSTSAVATYVVDNTGTALAFAPTTPVSSSSSSTLPQQLVDPDKPMVVWIDSRTASASEVLAGALRDNCRAVVMGPTPSFGKGLIQAVYGLNDGSGLVLTVAKYTTPNGSDIQGVGIQPDILVGGSPFPSLGPFAILGTEDASKIDFDDVGQRLSMCHVPEPRKGGLSR